MSKFKDLIYIILSFVIVVLMIFMTVFHLSKRQDNVASSSVETTTVTSNVESQVQMTNESTSVTSTDSGVTTTMTTEQSTNRVAHGDTFRFLYTAAGGDTLQTIYELTGVDVETLAKANDLDINVVLVKGQRVYVP